MPSVLEKLKKRLAQQKARRARANTVAHKKREKRKTPRKPGTLPNLTPAAESFDPDITSLRSAREWVKVQTPKGVDCPCCAQYAKCYWRPFNSGMARGLILLYRVSHTTREWIHVPSYKQMSRLGGDFAKLALYDGLIEERSGDRDDGAPHAGYWRITDAGVDFVERRSRIPQYLWMYNNVVLDISEETVSIDDGLNNKFDYNELMSITDEQMFYTQKST